MPTRQDGVENRDKVYYSDVWCCAKISFLISIVISFFIVLDTWEDETVMWHSSERVYLCTSEWFSDFQFLTTSVRTEYCVFFELSLKTIRPSWVFTGYLIYSKERLSWVRPHPGTKNSSKKLSVGRRGGVDDWGKKGKGKFSHSRPTYPPPPHPPLQELVCKLNFCILTATMHRLLLIFHVFLLRSSCAIVIAFEQNIEIERNVMQ